MDTPDVPTEYAPAGRASAETLRGQFALFQTSALHRRLFNTLPVISMALNSERQIVFANQALLDFSSAECAEDFCGLRFGEVLGCANALAAPSGCGTGSPCRVCGALEAILATRVGSRFARPPISAWRVAASTWKSGKRRSNWRGRPLRWFACWTRQTACAAASWGA